MKHHCLTDRIVIITRMQRFIALLLEAKQLVAVFKLHGSVAWLKLAFIIVCLVLISDSCRRVVIGPMYPLPHTGRGFALTWIFQEIALLWLLSGYSFLDK